VKAWSSNPSTTKKEKRGEEEGLTPEVKGHGRSKSPVEK
jgi:hypothetical protein